MQDKKNLEQPGTQIVPPTNTSSGVNTSIASEEDAKQAHETFSSSKFIGTAEERAKLREAKKKKKEEAMELERKRKEKDKEPVLVLQLERNAELSPPEVDPRTKRIKDSLIRDKTGVAIEPVFDNSLQTFLEIVGIASISIEEFFSAFLGQQTAISLVGNSTTQGLIQEYITKTPSKDLVKALTATSYFAALGFNLPVDMLAVCPASDVEVTLRAIAEKSNVEYAKLKRGIALILLGTAIFSGSFFAGAAADAVPLADLAQKIASGLTAKAIGFIGLGVFTFLGIVYYSLFNIGKFRKHASALIDTLRNFPEFASKIGKDILPFIEVLFQTLSNSAYRGIAFAFIMSAVMQSVMNVNPSALFSQAVIWGIGVSTFIITIMSRYLPTYHNFLNPKFDLLTSKEINSVSGLNLGFVGDALISLIRGVSLSLVLWSPAGALVKNLGVSAAVGGSLFLHSAYVRGKTRQKLSALNELGEVKTELRDFQQQYNKGEIIIVPDEESDEFDLIKNDLTEAVRFIPAERTIKNGFTKEVLVIKPDHRVVIHEVTETLAEAKQNDEAYKKARDEDEKRCKERLNRIKGGTSEDGKTKIKGYIEEGKIFNIRLIVDELRQVQREFKAGEWAFTQERHVTYANDKNHIEAQVQLVPVPSEDSLKADWRNSQLEYKRRHDLIQNAIKNGSLYNLKTVIEDLRQVQKDFNKGELAFRSDLSPANLLAYEKAIKDPIEDLPIKEGESPAEQTERLRKQADYKQRYETIKRLLDREELYNYKYIVDEIRQYQNLINAEKLAFAEGTPAPDRTTINTPVRFIAREENESDAKKVERLGHQKRCENVLAKIKELYDVNNQLYVVVKREAADEESYLLARAAPEKPNVHIIPAHRLYILDSEMAKFREESYQRTNKGFEDIKATINISLLAYWILFILNLVARIIRLVSFNAYGEQLSSTLGWGLTANQVGGVTLFQGVEVTKNDLAVFQEDIENTAKNVTAAYRLQHARDERNGNTGLLPWLARPFKSYWKARAGAWNEEEVDRLNKALKAKKAEVDRLNKAKKAEMEAKKKPENLPLLVNVNHDGAEISTRPGHS